MYDVYFDSKRYSEQLFYSMSVPNMARFAGAMVKKNHVYYVAMVANGHP